MLVLATYEDIARVIEITKKCQIIMNEIDKIKQWDNGYPNKETFINDIEKKQLYVYKVNNEIVGFIVLNTHEYEQYENIKWISGNESLVIHRFAVDPSFQSNGYGSAILQNIIKIAKEKNINYLKIDTSNNNIKMKKTILKNGFTIRGYMRLYEDETYPDWVCFDQLI